MPERLDRVIVLRGLASTRTRAQMLIAAGLVQVNGRRAEKAGMVVEETAEIVVTGQPDFYVSRGGLKLEAALRRFRLNVTGAVCLDVGASTGGFTDCLLKRGAARVVAVDVGRNQMAASLRSDPRVELHEGVNARSLRPDQFSDRFDVATVDVSFISLTLILPAVAPLVRPGGFIVALIKPEFEAGPEAVDARGIVRNPADQQRAIDRVKRFAQETLRLTCRGVMRSPIRGGSGNQEFLACFRVPAEEV